MATWVTGQILESLRQFGVIDLIVEPTQHRADGGVKGEIFQRERLKGAVGGILTMRPIVERKPPSENFAYGSTNEGDPFTSQFFLHTGLPDDIYFLTLRQLDDGRNIDRGCVC